MRIIDGLTEENLVRPTGKTEYSGGRTRTMLEFNGSEHLVIGLDLGGTKLYGGVADLQGNILHEERFSHHQTQADESFQVLCDFIDRLLEFANGTGLPLMGIGLGVPGATDRETGNVKLAPSLGWFDFPLKNRLEARYDLPMLIENDVNLAALGELWARPIDVENLVLITIGTGIGAGIVINRILYQGSHHMAGEIGYSLPDRSYLGQKFSGFGAFEQLASGNGIAMRAKILLSGKRPAEELENMSAEEVFRDARKGEDWAKEILAETVDYLAQAIAFIHQLLDPDVIILGGGVSREADLLIQPILDRLQGSIPALPKIEASKMGYQAAVAGTIMELLRINGHKFLLQKYS
jgi:glucokinase